MTESTKISINPDSFIFAINQAYEARLKANGEFNSHLRYEPFLTGTWTPPKIPDFTVFKNLLADIIAHHFKVLPNFQRNETVDLENISWFSHSIAALFADLENLLVSFTGSKLPKLTGNSIPRATSSKNIIHAIKKYADYLNCSEEKEQEPFSLFPLLSEEKELIDNLYIQEIWSLISSFAKKSFGAYFELISGYILWKYSIKEIQQEAIDWNIRPPCGAAYHKQFKELFDREREERFAKRNEKNNKLRQEKEKREHKSEEKKQHNKPYLKPTYNEKSNDEEQPIINNKSRAEEPLHLTKNNYHQLNGISTEQRQQQFLEDALQEAKQAVQKMVKNKNIPEISLAPQNSFIRRQQHTVATEAGFDTESRGEARNRHVCIRRKV